MARRLRLVVGETDRLVVAEDVTDSEALKEPDPDADTDADPDAVTEREELEETVGKLE